MRPSISSMSLVVLAISACQNLPLSTQGGDITDVIIGEGLAISTFEVNVGDEIRWTNTGMGQVRIVFTDRISSQVSCRRGFCGYFAGGLEAFLAPEESASHALAIPTTSDTP